MLIYAVAYLLMVLNLIIQNDSVGFLWRQPGQAHAARLGRHQVNYRHCRWRYIGQHEKKREIYFTYCFSVLCLFMMQALCASTETKYRVLGCRLCEKLWSVVCMLNHSSLMLKFSLPEYSGRGRECLIIL